MDGAWMWAGSTSSCHGQSMDVGRVHVQLSWTEYGCGQGPCPAVMDGVWMWAGSMDGVWMWAGSMSSCHGRSMDVGRVHIQLSWTKHGCGQGPCHLRIAHQVFFVMIFMTNPALFQCLWVCGPMSMMIGRKGNEKGRKQTFTRWLLACACAVKLTTEHHVAGNQRADTGRGYQGLTDCHQVHVPPLRVSEFSTLVCDWFVCLFVCWLLNVPATCECISGTDLHGQFYMLPHWDRSRRSNFPSHPVTVYWHRTKQSQCWP